ncbi:MAG: transglutaminase domain-containing protein [Oscillospiraceae bacterium]
MNKFKRIIFTAAILFTAAVISGCRDGGQLPDDGLPLPATEASSPTVSYDTEETTESTAPVTIVTTEKTKRTAASETTPELATTTSMKEASDGSVVSTVPDVPNVPISEFTSTTALEPSAQLSESATVTASSSSDKSTDSSSGTEKKSESVLNKESDSTVDDDEKTEYEVVKLAGEREIERPYSYNQLNEKQLYIYDAIITAVEQYRTDVPISTLMEVTAEDYCEVYQQIYNDEHALFYIDTKMQYAVNSTTKYIASAVIFYKYSETEALKMQKAIDAEADKIIGMITPEMTDYDKVKLFYDYLAENVVYDESAGNCRDIYGVFVDKKAICGGYSKAFSYLCDKVGIETITVTGDADGQPHMWNMVKIDGQWYNIDVTYAVTDSVVGSYVRYDYFCVPDEMLSSTRTVYQQIYSYPKAISEDCSYYVKNGLVADSWDDVRQMIKNQIIKCSQNKEMVIQVKCSSRELYEDATARLFGAAEKQAISIFEETLSEAANKYDCNAINYSQDDTSMVIKLFLKYTE